MKTIDRNVQNEFTINKSIFITEIIKIKNKEQVKIQLESLKNKYKEATHCCYAYIIDEFQKAYDDGEPKGTAGIPILEALNKLELNYVLCVVVRYFGGIKLGSGGLIRAYRKAAIDALKKANLKKLVDGYKIAVEVPYKKQSEIEFLLNDGFSKTYNETVIYNIECDREIKDKIALKYRILSEEEIKIEK